ncbi:MAG: LOG family protein, partial [Alloprevotella sp.]
MMMTTKRIGVFLSSKENLPEPYTQATLALGELIGRTGRTLVYGGARKGLMEVLAQQVKRHGGKVMGMVPDILVQRGLVSDAIDIEFRCADLSDRKAAMVRESDVLVALPGGIGTLDEVICKFCSGIIGAVAVALCVANVKCVGYAVLLHNKPYIFPFLQQIISPADMP